MISTPHLASYAFARYGLEDLNKGHEHSKSNEVDYTSAAASAPAVVSVSSEMAGVEVNIYILEHM